MVPIGEVGLPELIGALLLSLISSAACMMIKSRLAVRSRAFSRRLTKPMT